MFPGKFNPKQLQGMMKQLGMSQEEIGAARVVIEKTDGKIIIENPSVQKITMRGQTSFQISVEISEQPNENFSDEDVKLVAEKLHRHWKKLAMPWSKQMVTS